MISLVTIEDVLSKGDDLRTAPPQRFARMYYEQYKLDVSLNLLTKASEDIALWWLKKEGFSGWSKVLSWNQGMTWLDWRLDVIREQQAAGWEILMVVDADPQFLYEARHRGVATTLVSYPDKAPGWRTPTQAPRPWGDVVSNLGETS